MPRGGSRSSGPLHFECTGKSKTIMIDLAVTSRYYVHESSEKCGLRMPMRQKCGDDEVGSNGKNRFKNCIKDSPKTISPGSHSILIFCLHKEKPRQRFNGYKKNT